MLLRLVKTLRTWWQRLILSDRRQRVTVKPSTMSGEEIQVRVSVGVIPAQFQCRNRQCFTRFCRPVFGFKDHKRNHRELEVVEREVQ